MFKIFLLLTLSFLLAACATAGNKAASNICSPSVVAKRGCCSHHDGVCGCSEKGRVICCDGTLSPSCTCHHEDTGKAVE